MSETQKKVIETFEDLLPKMSREDVSYLLGYGEGMAAGFKQREDRDAENKTGQAES